MPAYPDLLYPLSLMRRTRNLPKLSFTELAPDEVPEPYHGLLIHDGDMTSRLEAFHESSLVVSPIRSSSDGKSYFREVLLKTKEDERIVEYGGIEISLNIYPRKFVHWLSRQSNHLEDYSTRKMCTTQALHGHF